MQNFLIVASEGKASPGLLQALGLDGKLLIEQTIAFLILVAILGKFVYPALIKAIDTRREQIEAGVAEAKQAEEALAKAEARVEEVLAEARKEADEIVARSQQAANATVSEAEDKAKARAERIVADAREQLGRDVTKARESLRQETISLVAAATEKIVGNKLDVDKDSKLIAKSIHKERA